MFSPHFNSTVKVQVSQVHSVNRGSDKQISEKVLVTPLIFVQIIHHTSITAMSWIDFSFAVTTYGCRVCYAGLLADTVCLVLKHIWMVKFLMEGKEIKPHRDLGRHMRVTCAQNTDLSSFPLDMIAQHFINKLDAYQLATLYSLELKL